MANPEETEKTAVQPQKIRSYSECRAALLKQLDELDPEEAQNRSGSSSDLRGRDAALIRKGILRDDQLVEIYSAVYGCAVLDESEIKQPELHPEISLDFCNANDCIPFEWDENHVSFYLADPYGVETLVYQVHRNWHLSVDFHFIRRSFLERMLSKQTVQQEQDDEIHDTDDENALRSMAGEARIVRLVNDIFTRALETGASDIHIEPGENLVTVRCRIDGVLQEIMTCPLNQFPAIASRIKLLGGLNIAESRLPQDGRTNIQFGGNALDMRISTIPILTGESIVLRLLNSDTLVFDLQTLGMSAKHLEQFNRLIRIPHGIILVVGPTGSGKTTTLYSVINQLNDQTKKIITVEDPVEYKTPGLCQMQVNAKVGVTFAAGLRSIVRQDPDIILVGEIRDRETADIAINAALTGHLVLSTLHTNDAVGAVTRLLDMGVEPFLVSSSLYGVLSQRLVRKICPDCHGVKTGGVRCKRCGGTGYKGRSGIFELLTVNDELRRAINKNASSSELQVIAEKNGMITLKQDGEAKVAQGITTVDELNRSTAEL